MLRKARKAILIWLLMPSGPAKTEREYYRDHAISCAIFMFIITAVMRIFGASNGALSSYGWFPDIAFNVIVGTAILHGIKRLRPVVYV